MAALYGGNKDEFVTVMAALALYDGDAEISSDNIKALLDASNNKTAPYWPALFAGSCKNGGIERMLFTPGGGATAVAGGAGPVAATAAGAVAVEEAAPAKPKEEEVDALDGGMDMFGGSGGGGDY